MRIDIPTVILRDAMTVLFVRKTAKSSNIRPEPFGFLAIYAGQDHIDPLSNTAGHIVWGSPLASFDAGE